MRNFHKVFDHWNSSPTAMATALGLPRITCQQWVNRDSVPVHHWPAITKATGIEAAELALMAQARSQMARAA